MIKSLIRITLSILSITLAAQISFDLNIDQHNIPITGQTLAVLAAALLLPRWEAIVAIVGYLVLGILGQPVFAEGASGVDELTGKGGGYLWGFITATFAVSSHRGYRDRKSLLDILQGNMIGTILILLCGFIGLNFFMGPQDAFQYGVLPFWMGAVVKIIAGTAIVYAIRKALD